MITNEEDYKDRVFCCDHVEDGEPHAAFIWAGKHTRFKMCRFCTTVALGTIASLRIQEDYGEVLRYLAERQEKKDA